MKKSIKIVLLLLLLVGILFQFIITFHKANDRTMASTIEKNNWVAINKAAAGAWFLGMKLPGLCNLEANDVIYFAYPEDFDKPMYDKRRLISRVIGTPGDRVQIKRKEVFVNGKPLPQPDSMQWGYRMMLVNDADSKSFFKKHQIFQEEKIIDSLKIFQVPLTAQKMKKIRKAEAVDYIRLIKRRRGGANRIFPKSPYRSWSEDDFGPIRVPKAGDKISLSYRNFNIYKNILIEFEGNEVIQHKGDIYINGKKSNSYTIQNNYYFVLDDNRDRFFDSREWGFVPEDYILGTVIGK